MDHLDKVTFTHFVVTRDGSVLSISSVFGLFHIPMHVECWSWTLGELDGPSLEPWIRGIPRLEADYGRFSVLRWGNEDSGECDEMELRILEPGHWLIRASLTRHASFDTQSPFPESEVAALEAVAFTFDDVNGLLCPRTVEQCAAIASMSPRRRRLEGIVHFYQGIDHRHDDWNYWRRGEPIATRAPSGPVRALFVEGVLVGLEDRRGTF